MQSLSLAAKLTDTGMENVMDQRQTLHDILFVCCLDAAVPNVRKLNELLLNQILVGFCFT